jgi:hypothetical protein
MQLEKWTPQRKNALRGFSDVRLPNGLVIYSCPVLFSRGQAWATFPGKPQIGRDGLPIKIDGKQQYTSTIRPCSQKRTPQMPRMISNEPARVRVGARWQRLQAVLLRLGQDADNAARVL